MPGIRVGQAERIGDGWLTGTTVVLPPDGGAVAGVDVRGGGPGTRETDALDPRNVVDRVHAVVLTGGSALGLASVDGVVQRLLDAGVGFPVGGPGEVVPIVPAAVVFDLGRGGVWRHHPDAALGAAAHDAASTEVREGVVGAGTGTRVGGLKGGVGTASARLRERRHGRRAGRRQRRRLGRRPGHRASSGPPATAAPGTCPPCAGPTRPTSRRTGRSRRRPPPHRPAPPPASPSWPPTRP